jgi:hypothetical protein
LVPITKVSEGQVVDKIGKVDIDPECALPDEISKEIGYAMAFLEKALDRARERYSAKLEQIVEFLSKSPALTVMRVKRGE